MAEEVHTSEPKYNSSSPRHASTTDIRSAYAQENKGTQYPDFSLSSTFPSANPWNETSGLTLQQELIYVSQVQGFKLWKLQFCHL